ncbi:MAG: cytochrome c class i [Adhaeribacter sp.]|jgi:cytochrome c oxidase cbb3-type subunit 3|nr:cytochrome c class i [Adhaeribacter sp.]
MKNRYTFSWPKAVLLLIGVFLLAGPVSAQEAAATPVTRIFPLGLLMGLTIAIFLFLLLVILLVIAFFQALPLIIQFYDHPARRNSATAKLIHLLDGNPQLITGKATNVLMADHSYDGIQEFDNDLPPWWKFMFYASIVFGVGYLVNFHVLESAPLQIAEYEAEMQQAALLSPKSGSNNANEQTNFKALTDAPHLEAGQAAYMQNCAACHGQKGEGVVGPNLTDEYWLHGGDVNAIFKTVKFGVTSKGMVAWQGKLSDDQILEVSSYILSVQGSNPANAKAPQGEKAK